MNFKEYCENVLSEEKYTNQPLNKLLYNKKLLKKFQELKKAGKIENGENMSYQQWLKNTYKPILPKSNAKSFGLKDIYD